MHESEEVGVEFFGQVTLGNDIEIYLRRFHKLATLCPSMVPNNEELLENFIGGLPKNIRGDVIPSDPQTLDEATRMFQKLKAQILRK